MSEISEAIQAKCLAFSDRIIKLNDYLLAQAVAAHENYKKSKIQKKGKQTSSLCHQTSYISKHIKHHPSNIKHLLIAQVVAGRCSSILPVRTIETKKLDDYKLRFYNGKVY